MKNHNVYDFTANAETAIKNGDIRQIILFSNIYLPINKFLNSFENKKEIDATDEFPYKQILIKSRNPFRIGEIHTRIIYLENIFNIDFNKNAFTTAIKDICKKFKGSINALPINGPLLSVRKDILDILEANVFNTKVVILN